VDKVRNIICNGSKPHDFLGVERELAGEDTGYDHVTEMHNNVRGLLDALGSIRGSLTNPTLPADVRRHLESVRAEGEAILARMQRTLAAARKGG